MSTHEVANQAPPLAGYDALAGDVALREAVDREGADWALPDLHELGRRAGDAAWLDRGARANAHPPVLRTHDRYGHRIDEVEFDPSWHELMGAAVGAGLAGRPWADPRPGAHAARAAGYLLWGQVEAGHLCPVTMTYASAAALRTQPELAEVWRPALGYDPALRPVADKAGALLGMAMTEKQGGSDVRANTTLAVPGTDGYRLTGHKWFCSAPMSDGFLVLAQAPGGLSCFLLPRVLPDGSRNAIRLQRLKDKLGNRSNASSEIELEDATAWLVGEEGRGVPVIAQMVNLTRLDCVLGSTGLIRRAVAEAIHHAQHRSAFGRLLADQPLMTAVLADLALESEAATVLGMRLAGAVDRAERGDEGEALLRRLGTAIGKYWVCKRAPAATYEALECLGGNGYVEESGMPRLYREAPVNSIWEGSGNVNVLDVLRVLAREPATAEALLTEIGAAAGGDARLDAFTAALTADLHALPAALADGRAERGARRLVERMALALQASLLVRHSPAAVADAFCAARLGDGGWAFGTLPDDLPAGTAAAIVARATPTNPTPTPTKIPARSWECGLHDHGDLDPPAPGDLDPPAPGDLDPPNPGDRDPRGLAAGAPLFAAWLRFVADPGMTPFTIPGHKQRTDLVGEIVRGDVPLYGGTDTVKQAGGTLAEAERLAAEFWGADWCRFSVGGSTHGNQAVALALGRPGDEVIVSRTLHRSMLLGLVLAGLRPVWVRPRVDPATGLPGAVPVEDVERALAEHPDARAVLLGEPSYVGTCGDVAGHATAAHVAGVPLVVDAAWGPHFGLHPDLPPHPLAAGADAVVMSAHKTLPAMNQAAIVLARTNRAGGMLDPDRLERGFEATHTTSPSGAILASTDAARALLARDGEALAGRLLSLVAGLRARLRAIPGLDVLTGPLPGGTRVDPSKLVVLLAGTGAHGVAVENELVAAGLPVEMADRDVVVPIVTVADTAETVQRLDVALTTAIELHRGTPRAPLPSAAWSVAPQTVMPPRDAFFAPHATVPADRAVGRVCAELVAPYPPGVPVLAPGELVTAEALAALRAARAEGGRIAYAADPTLATLQVTA